MNCPILENQYRPISILSKKIHIQKSAHVSALLISINFFKEAIIRKRNRQTHSFIQLFSFAFIIFLAFASSSFASPRLVNTGKYIYAISPLNELISGDKREIIDEALEVVRENITEIIGGATTTSDKINILLKNKQQISNLTREIQEFMLNDAPGINAQDLAPSALVFIVGGGVKFPLFKLRGAGSFNLGFLIKPSYVQRLDKTDPTEIRKYLTIESSIFLVPVGNIELGFGGQEINAGFRVGGGLIFGELDHPEEFHGIAGGISVNFSKFGGAKKLRGWSVHNGKKKFFYSSITHMKNVTGSEPIFAIEANIGWVKQLKSFITAVDMISGSFMGGSDNNYYPPGGGWGPYTPSNPYGDQNQGGYNPGYDPNYDPNAPLPNGNDYMDNNDQTNPNDPMFPEYDPLAQEQQNQSDFEDLVRGMNISRHLDD